MPFEIIRQDIVRMQVDAIVDSAHPTVGVGGGVDAAIHAAAGPELLEARRAIGPIATGEAFITPGFRLSARHVIHTVGPVWQGGGQGEEKLLRKCYRNALRLALDRGLESVAFPLLSGGIFGYPKAEAIAVAVAEIGAFVLKHDLAVWLVVYTDEVVKLTERLTMKVERYITDVEVEEALGRSRSRVSMNMPMHRSEMAGKIERPSEETSEEDSSESLQAEYPFRDYTYVRTIPAETFSEMLLRLIDERGGNDVEVYKRANIDKKHFAKIRADKHYQPKKPTVIAFAMALRLTLDETNDLLLKAGFALSPSLDFDRVCKSFISHRNYDIFELNFVLFERNLPQVGTAA